MWGIVGFAAVLVLLALGIHVGLSLAVVGFVGIIGMTGSVKFGLGLLTTTPYATTASFAFTVLPLFIIMGLFATHAGMSSRAFDTAYKWVGRLPGGLAIATRGPTPCSALHRLQRGGLRSVHPHQPAGDAQAVLRQTLRLRHHRGSGMLGMLIPPSALMVIYGILTEQSIGILLIAGSGPAPF